MHASLFLQDMAVVMLVSAFIVILCQRFQIPVVLGYIVAGVIIGPHTPPSSFVRELESIHTLSQLGVILLLFFIGLEFSLSKLFRVGWVALLTAVLEIAFMMGLGFGIGNLMHWKFMDCLFLGAILAISSTTIIAKVLMDMRKVKEKFSQIILGILVVEDLIAILIIAVLSGLASSGALDLKVLAASGLKVGIFIAAISSLGIFLIPKLLCSLAKFENWELMGITVLGLCFGVSLAAEKAGLSPALGSFLIGAIIAETKQAEGIIHRMESIKDMFTAIFFVSVGLLFVPSTLTQLWIPILLITAATLFGKILSCSIGTKLAGYSWETSLKVGLGLAQIGEFSFIIAQLGETTHVTSPFLYPIAVAVSCITTMTTPILMKKSAHAFAFPSKDKNVL